MIDNTYDQLKSARNQNPGYNTPNQSLFYHSASMEGSGINEHLTSTKKKRTLRSEQTTNYANQGYCSECGNKTIWNCSQFLDDKDDPDAKDIWMCHTETGRIFC